MPNYRQLLPIIQSNYYSCWAAATAWWTKAMSDRGRKAMTEEDVSDKFMCGWDKNGAMTMKGLADIFRSPLFNMQFRLGSEKDLDRLMQNLTVNPLKRIDAFPIICGYNDPKAGGNHVGVLCELYDEVLQQTKFVVMDPATGYVVRSRNYLASQTMVFAWAQEAGDIIYG